MTKMIKLSLVAAVAVAGLSTTASAGSLEEAIKGVNINGKVEVGYNYTDNKLLPKNSSTNEYEYDLDITAVVPVNDTITATTGIQADHVSVVDNNTSGTSNSTDANGAQSITLTKAYFTYANNGNTVMVGKQALNTPFEDDRRGDGIVALTSFGAVTAAAAHFESVNLTANNAISVGGAVATDLNDETVNAIALIGSVEGFNLSGWYLNSTAAHGYTLNATTKIEGISIDARHTSLEVDSDGAMTEDQTLTKIVASVGVDQFTFIAGYGKTNKENKNSLGRGFQAESDADFHMNQLHLGNFAEAKAFLLGAVVPVGPVSVTALYLSGALGDEGTSNAGSVVGTNDLGTAGGVTGVNVTNSDFNEINLEVSYSMSKNFTVSGLYSSAEIELAGAAKAYDVDMLELSLLYTF